MGKNLTKEQRKKKRKTAGVRKFYIRSGKGQYSGKQQRVGEEVSPSGKILNQAQVIKFGWGCFIMDGVNNMRRTKWGYRRIVTLGGYPCVTNPNME